MDFLSHDHSQYIKYPNQQIQNEYSVNSSSIDTSLQDLGPGNYEITVTDEEGCVAIASITITEPTALTLSGVVSDYNGFGVTGSGASDGEINITG